MKVVRAEDVPFEKHKARARDGGFEFRRLLEGPPGEPDNFDPAANLLRVCSGRLEVVDPIGRSGPAPDCDSIEHDMHSNTATAPSTRC